MNPRLKELLDRMVAPGQFPNMSASEGHELFELVHEMETKLQKAKELLVLAHHIAMNESFDQTAKKFQDAINNL